jgi:hypothetical protein
VLFRSENVNQFKEGNFKAVEVIEVKDDEYANGGFMADGGEITYAVVNENTDRIYVKSKNEKFIKLKYNELKEVYPTEELSIVEFKSRMMADGGFMAEGGYTAIGEDYEYVNTFGIDQDDFNAIVEAYHLSPSYDQVDRIQSRMTFSKMRDKYGRDKVDEIGNYIHETHEANSNYNNSREYMADGGFMEHGGVIAYANDDYDNKIGLFNSMLDAKKFAKANKWRYDTILFEDEYGDNIIVSKDDTFKDVDYLFADSFKNGGMMAKGGFMAKGGVFYSDSHKLGHE